MEQYVIRILALVNALLDILAHIVVLSLVVLLVVNSLV
jgi:hypothetical protein